MEDLVQLSLIVFLFFSQTGFIESVVILILLILLILMSKPIGSKISKYFYKKLKEQAELIHTDSLNARKRNILKINYILEELRTYFKCDRALIFEYHNGGTNLSGLSFHHMSVTFEKNVLGAYPIAQQFQKLALSLFPNLILDLENTDCLYINIKKNINKYLFFCLVLLKVNIIDAVIVPLYGSEDPIGFIVLCSDHPKRLQETDRQALHKEAQRIASLLDYKILK